MDKEIIMQLDETEKIHIHCEGRKIDINDNTISAQEIYELLDYQSGNSYSITTEVIGKRVDVFNPIKVMFDQIVSDINKLKNVSDQVQADLEELGEVDIEMLQG